MKSRLSANRIHLAVIGLSSIAVLGLGTPAFAQQSSTIAQGFQSSTSNGKIVGGAIVSSTSSGDQSVTLALPQSSDQLVGIVDTDPLVAISKSDNEVQVVLSGTTTVLVTDINGEIKNGDKIAISPIAGVGMRATDDGQIVGTAQNDFKSVSARTIRDKNGDEHRVHMGQVSVQVGIAFYQSPGSDFLPPFIQSFANSIAGRPVSLIRVLISGVVLLLGFTSVIILVYTSVRSAITSIGRNPLAARAIRKGLYQVGIVSLTVVAGTLIASYLALSL